MSGINRLPGPYGKLIDRGHRVRFSFEGKRYDGLSGDTLASALAAHGVVTLSRSFKYRRPRGILSAAGQDANSLVQLPGEPNVLADRLPIRKGLVAQGQNYSGSLAHDRGRALEWLAPFLPVGFYYKAFFRPRGVWRFWEKIIRARAGLGRVDVSAAGKHYEQIHEFADVAVIGGGAAGMAAALGAADAGADVLLIEEDPILGGALNYVRFDVAGQEAARHRRLLVEAVENHARIRIFAGAQATGLFADGWIPFIRADRLHKLRAGAVVAATGAFEQPAVFRRNDLPGIMLGSAAQRLMQLYAVRPGRRAVVVTANDEGYGVALDLLDAGVTVAAVADLRARPESGALRDAIRGRGVAVYDAHAPLEARADRDGRVRSMMLAPIPDEAGWTIRSRGPVIACDLVVLSAGYQSAINLLTQSGAKAVYDETRHALALSDIPAKHFVAGSANGCADLDGAIADGGAAGHEAAAAANGMRLPEAGRPSQARFVNHPYPIFPHPKGKDFVDFDEDLTVRDITDAVAEGYDRIELTKRYSTVGMGPSQGRLSNLAAIRLVARATGRTPAEVGVTTARPPFGPEKFGTLGGAAHHPARLTAMHHRHVELGATLTVAGSWLRPAFYGAPDRAERRIAEEVRSVRENVGIVDVSTLGGFDLRGLDAAEFLERFQTFVYKKQAVGRARYALTADLTGAIVDDGVACRLAEDHFYVTATTTGAERIHQSMLWWNAQWRLDVDIANVTGAFCAVNVAGPRSRRVLQSLVEGVDLSPEAFAYMGVRQGRVAGIPARLIRVGFVGELGFEIHCAANDGEKLWDALMEAGREFALRPFGVDAQRILRLEKGHIIVGQDTDALTHPFEADLAWAVSLKKPFFVGKRAIEIRNRETLQRKLVGFTLVDETAPPPAECQIVVRGHDIVGRVTSCVWSPTLARAIGLAYVAPDQAAPGAQFFIRGIKGDFILAQVTALPFYDPQLKRQEM